jgi:predicted amidophosphoribosyltransferase
MPLVTCPDCGRSVSDAAAACPACARPLAAPPVQTVAPTFWTSPNVGCAGAALVILALALWAFSALTSKR